MAVNKGIWFENQEEIDKKIKNLDEDGNFIVPTTDPAVVGALWNDEGTLSISAG